MYGGTLIRLVAAVVIGAAMIGSAGGVAGAASAGGTSPVSSGASVVSQSTPADTPTSVPDVPVVSSVVAEGLGLLVS
jgi:hypothetical protein